MWLASSGANTSDSANISAMLPPTNAMALVRTSSRVKSASSAVTAAEIAPAPCSARPATSQFKSGAQAATKLPSANISSPATITRLRPHQSEASPKGICSSACVRPYTPSARPTRTGSSPPGKRAASSAKTGSTKNSPSMRRAKIDAKEALARRSVATIDKDCGAEDTGKEVKRLDEKAKNQTKKRTGYAGLPTPAKNPILCLKRGFGL